MFGCCANVTGHAIYGETHIEVSITQHTIFNMMAVNYDTIRVTTWTLHTLKAKRS